MLDLSTFSLFVIASLALLLTPGPAVFYIVARSVGQGRPAGLASALGVAAGALFHVAAAAYGLSAVLMRSSTAFMGVKYAGALYLVYLGISRILSREKEKQSAFVEQASLARVFCQGVIVNILNPKIALFFFAFLPQFVDPSGGSYVLQILLLGGVFVSIGILSDGAYALAAGSISSWFRQSRRSQLFQRYVSGGALIGLGVATALSGARNSS